MFLFPQDFEDIFFYIQLPIFKFYKWHSNTISLINLKTVAVLILAMQFTILVNIE